ncbi:MAG TPA: AmmeMemoRadiSam system protein B, partial [Blastocatellia bacterium]|nr:AmmeMemoRadiSam system protein B [Blastocatellia bacterium]
PAPLPHLTASTGYIAMAPPSGLYSIQRMIAAGSIKFPRIRLVDARPVVHQGQRLIILRDPLHLTDRVLAVPQQLAPILALCDGTREDPAALNAALAVRFGSRADIRVIEHLLRALDDAVLLDNDRFRETKKEVLDRYRTAEFRDPALAGPSYPEDPDELRTMLDGYVEQAGSEPNGNRQSHPAELRGLVSPHIDYMRGGPVYARVWKEAEDAVRAADLVIILGTDHYGGDGSITLTRQNYASPLGVLPTATGIVDALAREVGPDAAYEGELRHCGEHSIELAAVWLQYIREGQECEVVPILCGSFARFTQRNGGESIMDASDEFSGLIEVLNEAARGRKALFVAAGDLSHVGPAFGGPSVDFAARALLQQQDEELIDRICAVDAEGFLSAIRAIEDRNNVCGVSPIYLALKALGQGEGYSHGYNRCPADETGTSLVSICGATIS